MRLLLLTISLILLLRLIKTTKTSLSYKAWKIAKEKSVIYDNRFKDDETYRARVVVISALICWSIYILLIVYYIKIGTRFSNTHLFWLSALQILTVFVSWKNSFRDLSDLYECKQTLKFKRWWYLFNVVLDYIYYPMAIYMLMW